MYNCDKEKIMREYDVQLKNELSLPKGYIDIPENEMSDICGGV